jgi:hypothetical protein
MKPYRVGLGLCAFTLVLCAAEPALAAWNNVFQATCFFRNRTSYSGYQRPAVAYSSPVVAYSSPIVAYSVPAVAAPSACCDPCPQTQCTTQYVQRSYYQPVTTYQTQSYYEPVTTYRTSYYAEPVTSYRYSCYYDPCTCQYQKVAVPTTSYQIKAQNCPVQSWVQRCTKVPVTTYQQSYYWEPKTTCCTTSGGAVTTTPPVNVTPQPLPSAPPRPNVQDNLGAGTDNGSGIYEKFYGGSSNQNGGITVEPPQYPNYNPPLNNKSGTTLKPLSNPSRPPAVKLDRIVSAHDAPWEAAKSVEPVAVAKSSKSFYTPISFQPDRIEAASENSWVSGKVVQDNNAPRANTQLMFIHADRKETKQFVTANQQGQFHVSLASGRWLVYVHQPNGQPVLHSQVDVNGQSPTNLTLLNR